MSKPVISRRGLFAAGGAALIGAAGGYALGSRDETVESTPVSSTVEFFGEHQAGIDTRPQTYTTFIGFDLREADADKARAVLSLLSDDAARLTQGIPSLADSAPELAQTPARLTVGIGLGHSLFEKTGRERDIPLFFPRIPEYSTDAFEDPWSQTDFVLQIGSDDPTTLSHTIRTLTKTVAPIVDIRWQQDGFRSVEAPQRESGASRNLMSQVDGTVNPGTDDFDTVVWISEGPDWAVGGTVLVLRRIRLLLDTWETLERGAQELIMGRRIESGAPLHGNSENDPLDFDAVDDLGLPAIPTNAHVRVAHAATTEEMILRRPYNYDLGLRDGKPDAGQLFAAYTSDPRRSFIPMQERIAQLDAFNAWNTTIGSATYIFPRGALSGGYVGDGLFA